ncbi:hypothetical protein M3Y98_00382700 [Aphelenchoides besseyi]|nr:hypothetical protein M3Y98_00382700 [Aphelenchoides besseyi]KAI6201957.1 hypothetical protein M3Y96_00897500 [Aphelenchoides besseyi]
MKFRILFEIKLFVLISLLAMSVPVAAKCPEEACGTGFSCDYKTGSCQKFRIPDGFQLFASDWNKCEFVKCPNNYACDGTSGVCTRVRPQHVQLAIDECEGVECPPDLTCFEGKCIRKFNGYDFDGVCRNIHCPIGFQCTPPDGVCRPLPVRSAFAIESSDPIHSLYHADDFESDDVRCPKNSQFEKCGSSCVSTCTEVQPKCKSSHHDCIPTCSCKDGYVQVSALNTTCVAAKECIHVMKEDNCRNLQCDYGMHCLSGICNPEDCPQILKPAINNVCNKIIVVRDRRNCVALLNECDLRY